MIKRAAIIADIHFGIRDNAVVFTENICDFLDNIFFPTLEKEGITEIINCGDLFDNRKNINTWVINKARDHYYKQIVARGMHEHLVIGNHDTYFRESNQVNSPEEVFADVVNSGAMTIYQDVTQVDGMLFVPWINKQNREHAIDLITKSTAKFCFGHFDLNGFRLNAGSIQKKGYDSSMLAKFHLVCTGHFHHRQTINNITYVGSPTQHNWGDSADVRGFHILDFDKSELTFIPNPFPLYRTITYQNMRATESQIESCKNKYVRIYYGLIEKDSEFRKFKNEIEEVAIDVRTISGEDRSGKTVTLEHMSIEVEDTKTMILNASGTNDDLRLLLEDIHTEALAVTN